MTPRPLVQVGAFLLAVWLTLGSARHSAADDPKSPTEAPKAPPGWKEYSPADGTYAIFVPEKSNRRSERSSSRTVNGVKIQVNALFLMNNNGPNYVVEEALISPNLAKKLNRGDLENVFRDEAAKVIGGKVADEKDATVVGVSGKDVAGKEYRIEGKSIARVRIVVVPNRTRVFIARIEGTKDQVDSDEAKVFLESSRLTAAKKDSSPDKK